MNSFTVEPELVANPGEWHSVSADEKQRVFASLEKVGRVGMLQSIRMRQGLFTELPVNHPNKKTEGLSTLVLISRRAKILEVEIGYLVFLLLKDAPQPSQESASFEARYLVTFELGDDETVSDREAWDYGCVAAAMLTWPMAREFLLSNAPRLGFGMAPLPLMNLDQMIDMMANHWRKPVEKSAPATSSEA